MTPRNFDLLIKIIVVLTYLCGRPQSLGRAALINFSQGCFFLACLTTGYGQCYSQQGESHTWSPSSVGIVNHEVSQSASLHAGSDSGHSGPKTWLTFQSDLATSSGSIFWRPESELGRLQRPQFQDRPLGEPRWNLPLQPRRRWDNTSREAESWQPSKQAATLSDKSERFAGFFAARILILVQQN